MNIYYTFTLKIVISQCFKSMGIIPLLFVLLSGCKTKNESGKNNASFEKLTFEYTAVDTSAPFNPWAKFSGDLDNDGVEDIIIGGQKGPLVWYKYPDWSKYLIAEGGYNTVDGEVGDLDGDGDLDVVMGGLFWYENNGNILEDPAVPWKIHLIADHPTHDIEIADLDGDGQMDVITRNQSEFNYKAGNSIHLWMNTGTENWTENILECPHGEGIVAGDLDGDGDMDIVTGGIWFENHAPEWRKHHFTNWHPNASAQIADINRDGRKDIVLTPSELAGSYHRISWLEGPADWELENWTEHLIFDSIECVIHSLAVGDLNMDEAIDIVYAEMHQGKDPDEVVVLLNMENGAQWDKKVLSNKGSHGIRIADVNNDNLLDIFGANWSSEYQPVELWINKFSKTD